MTLDLSLAYRVITMEPSLPHPSVCPGMNYAALKDRLKAQRELIKSSTILRADGVAEWYAGHSKTVWDLKSDIPNFSPPFRTCWIEWREPKTWLMDKGVVESKNESQVGVWIMAGDVNDENRDDAEGFKKLISYMLGCHPSMMPDDCYGRIKEALLDSKWVLLGEQWLTAVEHFQGRPFWSGYSFAIFVSPSGGVVDHILGGPSLRFSLENHGSEAVDGIYSPIHIAGLAYSFCHCKNVVIQKADDDRGARFHKRTKTPILTYRTLDICPMKDVLRKEGQIDSVGVKRAMHICRGHFATYTEDAPLFGRITGTVFRPQHVRGAEENGVVVKNYSVKT